MKTRLILSMVIGLALPAGLVKDFTAGSGAPGTQGWTPETGVLSGSLVDVDGTPVWEMTGDNCCGYWFSGLTDEQWIEAFEKGWSLSGKARVTEGASVGYIFLDVPADISNRWDLLFGLSGGKGWVGLSMFTDSGDPALKYTLPDDGFHHFDMRYDPDTKTAGLWVDGVKVLSGYEGHDVARESHGPAFGAHGFTTTAQFKSVQFSITDPVPGTVPEPATWLTMAAGAIVLGLRRRAR